MPRARRSSSAGGELAAIIGRLEARFGGDAVAQARAADTDIEYLWQERAAVYEYDGSDDRAEAERRADRAVLRVVGGVQVRLAD